MNLYFGYLLVQFCLLAVQVFEGTMSNSAIFFLIVVVLFWSLIPCFGYLLAKLFKANSEANEYTLFIFGFVIALIEKSLFYFELLVKEQIVIGTFVAFILFFIVAYITPNRTTDKKTKQD